MERTPLGFLLVALGAALAAPIGSAATLLVATGACGAFTTFSSFAVETVSAATDGETDVAVGFAAANLAAALVAFLAGSALVGAVA